MPKKQTRLVDFTLDQEVVLEAATDSTSGLRRLTGVVAQGGIVNRNGRLYKTEVYKSAVDNVKPMVTEGSFTGELDHPSYPQGSLERIALRFTKLFMENDLVKFEAVVLNTASGQNLAALLEGGVKVGMSTRGLASLMMETINGEQVAVVQNDLKLYGVDAVKVPSNPAGEARLKESLEESFKEDLTESEEDIMDLKELKDKHPALVTELTAEVSAPLQARVATLEGELTEAADKFTALESEKVELEGKLTTSNSVFEKLGISLREAGLVKDTETVKVTESATTEADTLKAQVVELQSALATAVNKIDAAENAKKLTAAFEGLVKGHKHETILRESIDPTILATEVSVKAEVDRLVKVAEAVSSKNPPAGKGVVEEGESTTTDQTARWRTLAGISPKEA